MEPLCVDSKTLQTFSAPPSKHTIWVYLIFLSLRVQNGFLLLLEMSNYIFLIKKNAKAYTFVKSDAYRNFYLKAFTARAYTEYLNLMGISAKMRGIIVNLNAL